MATLQRKTIVSLMNVISVATMFVSIYALFNIYMYVIAYLYSPNLESLEDLQFKQTRKEHE